MPELTTGAPARTDPDLGTIARTVRARASRTKVWEALTTPAHVAKWWRHPMHFPDGIRAGSVGVFEWADGPDFPVRIDLVEEPSRYQLTWGFGEDLSDDRATTVLFELAEDGDGTLITVTETGFDRYPDLAGRRAAMEENRQGWDLVLDWLCAYVDGAPR